MNITRRSVYNLRLSETSQKLRNLWRAELLMK